MIMKILLLEDDKNLHTSLKAYFELENFEVVSAYDSSDVYNLSFKEKFDLYIFDVNVPGDNGFEILKYLKHAQDNTPTIYITALVDIDSIKNGFDAGADDYVKKPFDPEELVLRIKNRYQKKELLTYQDISYDINSKKITKNEKSILLGEVLSNLFHTLFINKNKIVPTQTLYDLLEHPNPNALRVNISKLKSKLNLNIKNIRNRGYILEES